jgi:hypothetical protein
MRFGITGWFLRQAVTRPEIKSNAYLRQWFNAAKAETAPKILIYRLKQWVSIPGGLTRNNSSGRSRRLAAAEVIV